MDYSKGKIYCIRNHVNDEVYVGSTRQPLSSRMAEHRRCLTKEKEKHRPLYVLMSELGVEHFYIELIEEFPCNNKEQLCKREGHYIREMGSLNKVIPGRENKEWYEQNKEKILEHRKEYREQNKDKIKEYYEQNKNKIKEYIKNYCEQNKDKIKEYRSEKIACDICGANVRRDNMSTHKRSIKCQSHMCHKGTSQTASLS